jgi:hypothetical protein
MLMPMTGNIGQIIGPMLGNKRETNESTYANTFKVDFSLTRPTRILDYLAQTHFSVVRMAFNG